MLGGRKYKKLKKEQMESWLEQIMVPVEPNTHFIRRLRARLVTYQGSRMSSGWMAVVVIATTLLFVITAFGLFIRIILGWVGLINIIRNKDREPADPQTVSV